MRKTSRFGKNWKPVYSNRCQINKLTGLGKAGSFCKPLQADAGREIVGYFGLKICSRFGQG
jgi:hypothetical protein